MTDPILTQLKTIIDERNRWKTDFEKCTEANEKLCDQIAGLERTIDAMKKDESWSHDFKRRENEYHATISKLKRKLTSVQTELDRLSKLELQLQPYIDTIKRIEEENEEGVRGLEYKLSEREADIEDLKAVIHILTEREKSN